MSDALDDFRRRETMHGQSSALAVIKAAKASGLSPDTVARNSVLARRNGVTPDVVAAKPDLFEADLAADEAADVLARSNAVRSWVLSSKGRAISSADDLPALADTAQTVADRRPRQTIWESVRDFPSLAVDAAKGTIDSFARAVDSAIMNDKPVLPWARRVASDLTPRDIALAGAAGIVGLGESAVGIGAMVSPTGLAARAIGQDDPIEGAARAFGNVLSGVRQDIRPEAETAEGRGVLSGIESTPASVVSLIVGARLRSATAAATLMGGMTGGTSYLKGRREGLSQAEATGYAAIDAAIETGTERLPMGQLLGGMNAGAPFVERLIKSTMAEIPGEQIATFAQDFNQWAFIDANKGKTIGDFLAERPEAAYETLWASLVTSGGMNVAAEGMERAARRFGRTYEGTFTAERDAQTLELLQQMAAASKLAQRDPVSFEEFVKDAAEGSTATDVFIDAGQLATVMQQSGLQPEAMAELTGVSVNDLEVAVQTGGDVRIPIEVYAARIAPTDVAPALADYLRIDPEGMSRAEAKVFMQSAEQEFKQLAAQEINTDAVANEATVARDRVRDAMLEELNATGRFAPGTNFAYATLHAHAMAAIGAREGMTAEQMAQRYGLAVQSDAAAAPTFDQSEQVFRGLGGDSGGGNYYSTDREFARNFTRSGQDSEIVAADFDSDAIYTPSVLPLATQEDQMDAAIAEALAAGKRAVRVSEGEGEPSSIFVIDPAAGLPLAPSATFNQSEAFKAWFGDSKVVDENGEPLVVYHGTKGDVKEFDASRQGQSDFGASGRGFYFTQDPGTANLYAMLAPGDGDPNIMPVYLSIRNPYELGGLIPRDAVEAQLLSDRVKDAGYDGIFVRGRDGTLDEIIAFEPTQIKALHNRGTFDPNDPRIMHQSTGQPRGQIAFTDDMAQSVMTLLRGADLSTFLHESGHFYWQVMTDLAARPEASEGVKDDAQAMLDFVGVADLATWRGMTVAEQTPGHEKIARAFEAYLFEGKAPSAELQGAFARFARWLRAVYRQIAGLDVELTPEVRGVFDRMLASEQEIADVQAQQGLEPFFETRPETVSEAEWAAYQREGLEATEVAVVELGSRSLRDMQYAGRATARAIKALQREAKDNRKAVQEEVAEEFAAMPVYRATALFRTGKLDGVPVEGDYKLYTPEVRDALRLDEGEPTPQQLNGMTSTQRGVHPQQMADAFGYSSIDAMLNDLLFATPLAEAIEAETDNRMRERFGELSSPQDIEAAAQAAVHNDVRGRFVATELAIIQKAPGKRSALIAAATKLASDTINRLPLRAVRPGQYEAGERRSARQALEQRGDVAAAAMHKRNQLLQFHLARAAHAARDDAERIRKYLSKFNKTSIRANIDKAFLDQIDQLLEAVQLRPISDAEAGRRKQLAAWVEDMREQGFEPMVDPEFLATINRRAWRDLTVDEIRQLDEAVRNVEWLGRRTKELLTAKDKADLDAAAVEVAEGIRTHASRSIPENVGAPSWWDGVKRGVNDFFAWHRKFANMVYVMDGNQYGGPVWERFVRGMNEAGDRETTMNAAATKQLDAIFRMLSGEDLHTRRFIPEINNSLSLEARLMVALNMGNSINRSRLHDGDKWTPEQLDAIVAPLTAEHWNFVEQVWEFIDGYWPQVAAKQERVTGIAPEKVEAEPFQVTVNGELRLLRGGYFPIKYDPDRSSRAEAQEADAVLQQMRGGLFTRATTRRGHTKERVDVVKRPLRKDFGVVFGHTTQVIHDLAWHEYLIDANRLLGHPAVDAALREHYGPSIRGAMREALKGIAVGDIPAMNAIERAANYIRAGSSIASMGWSIWTSLLQPVGLTQSISRIGAKHVMRGIGDLFGSPSQMNAKLEWVYEVSPFMRERARTMQREVNEVRNRVGPQNPVNSWIDANLPRMGNTARVIGDSFFYMLGKAQLVADLPTWLGQYHKSMEAGEGSDRAAMLADQAVIDSQSSGMIKDLAGVQRGSPILKLFTNFYSYFSATYNLMSDRTGQLKRVGVADLPYFAVDMMLLTIVPASITSIMFTALRGTDDDWEELPAKLLKDNLAYLFGTMIGLREASAALSEFSYGGPSGARVFAELAKFGKQVRQGEVDEPLLRSANALGGVLLHYPSAQIDRTVRGAIAWANGDTGPQAVLMGPPVKSK